MKGKRLETRLAEWLERAPEDRVVLTSEDVARILSTSRFRRVNPDSMRRARLLMRLLRDLQQVSGAPDYQVHPGPRGGFEQAVLSGARDAIIRALRLLRQTRRAPSR